MEYYANIELTKRVHMSKYGCARKRKIKILKRVHSATDLGQN